jgi:hypothetical protein
MTESKKQQIGDPLQEAAQTGVLGARRPIGTRQEAPSTPAPAAPPEPVAPTQPQAAIEEKFTKKGKPERRKKTILFLPERARWLDIQAATEGREQSEIVNDALELYEKLHAKER